jgi:hypothetical protein
MITTDERSDVIIDWRYTKYGTSNAKPKIQNIQF